MAFISGSITDAAPGPALYAAMEPALTTAGFTLVDTVVISTRTHKVWKSPAAANIQNLDWYLDIAYTTTGAGTISIIAFEMFDPATDLAYRGPIPGSGSGSTIDAATGSRYGAAGYALETNWFNASMPGAQTSITTAAFGYWISVTADRVVLLCSGSPDIVLYAGFYEPDTLYADRAGSLLFPLYSGRALGGTSYTSKLNTAGLTRVPPLTAFTTTATWASHLEGSTPGSSPYPRLPTDPNSAYPYSAFRCALTPLNNVSPANRIGRYGWLRDCWVVPSTGVVRGDTCTIGGSTHVLSTTVSELSLAFKAV